MNATLPTRPSLMQIVLGVFIVGQLLFLIGGNATHFMLFGHSESDPPPTVLTPVIALDKLASGWEQVSGQGQNWRLFAPLVPARAMFLTVQERHAAGLGPSDCVRLLPSAFEPREETPALFGLLAVHPYGAGDRVFHQEMTLAQPLVAWDQQRVLEQPVEWRDYLRASIHRDWQAYLTYLCWRATDGGKEQARDLVLFMRIYPPARRSSTSEAPAEVPVVRWRPGQQPPRGFLPLDYFDNVLGRFVPLPELLPPEGTP
jgi:hypothetical protein